MKACEGLGLSAAVLAPDVMWAGRTGPNGFRMFKTCWPLGRVLLAQQTAHG